MSKRPQIALSPVADDVRAGISWVKLVAAHRHYWTGRSYEAPLALVNVPYGVAGDSMLPLGLASIGAFLASSGFKCTGFDFSDSEEDPESLVSEFDLANYPIVGLSVYNTNALTAYAMAMAIKHRSPHTLVMIGGPHATAGGRDLLLSHPNIDLAVSGEGELTCEKLLLTLFDEPSPEPVAGTFFRWKADVFAGGESRRIDDIDDLPAPVFPFRGASGKGDAFFYDRSEMRLRRAIGMVTSRSCPYNCSFCAIILIGRRWRAASPWKVVSDLRELEADRVEYEHIYFLDANFFVSAERALEVARALHAFRPALTFSFSTRVNQLLRGENSLVELRSLGLRAVELGIESGSDAALLRFAKDTKASQNDAALKLLRAHGLELFLDFINFDAEASLQDLISNLDFLARNGLDSYLPWDHIYSVLTPYLGTPIRKHYEQILGRVFSDDHLPDSASLFVDPTVAEVYKSISETKRLLPSLRNAIQTLQEEIASGGLEKIALANARLTEASLRRVPFVVLRSIVEEAARSGSVPSATAVLPTYTDETGRSHTLQEVLNYILS